MVTALRFAWRTLATMVILVSGAALLLGVLVPRFAGATPYTVRSDSMTPALRPGSLVVVRPVDPQDIRIGTVVTFQIRSGEPGVATHRVVGIGTTVGGDRMYRTKGDANEVADVEPVRDVQIRGRTWYSVPYLGHVSALVGGQERQTFAVLVAVALIGYAAWHVVCAARERRGSPKHVSRGERPGSAPDDGVVDGEVGEVRTG